MAMIYDYQQKLELDVMKQMADEAAEKAVKTGENPAEAIGKAMAEYYAMFNDKKDTLVVTRKQTRIEDVDLYSENISRKTRREKKRTRNGYTVGNYKRKPERKDKRRKAFAEKKEQDKYTGDRLLDRRPGWNYDTIKDMSAKEAEAEARKNADNDLNRYQMNCNGAYYNGLIRERDLKEGKINDLNDIISGYHSDAQEMLKNMDELAEQINALQEKYNNIASHYAHVHECRERAEKSLDYNKILFDMYDNIIKNLVLGIED